MFFLFACVPHPGGVASTLRSEDAFTAAVVARLTPAVAPVTVAVEGPLAITFTAADGTQVGGGLSRVLASCRAAPGACEAEIDQMGTVARELLLSVRAPPTADQLIEAVRDQAYIDTIVRTGGRPLATPIAADLYRVTMLDQHDRTRAAMMEDLGKLALSAEEVAKRADQNTRAQVGHVRDSVHALPNGAIGALETGQFYTSSMLLQTDEWAEVAALGAGTLAVSVPHNQTLLYTWVRNDAELVALKETTARMYGAADRPISTRVLLWSGQGWAAAP